MWLSWLRIWVVTTVVAWVQFLAWELPYTREWPKKGKETKEVILSLFFHFVLFSFCHFLGRFLRHMGIPRLGVKLEL